MNDKSEHKWTVGIGEGGKWYAVATNAPYFCFEGDSEQEVDRLANLALDFYFETKGRVAAFNLPGRRSTTICAFSPRRVTERERV